MQQKAAGAPATAVAGSEILKVATASFIGTAIEWYDYFLFGTAAATVFNKLFFPTFDPLVGTLLALMTFAIGFVARPVGGIFFGHYGDRIGRKTMLFLTLIIMGAGTFAIGLLPGYASIGIWAPILLVSARILQGFALGGEWGGAVLMAVEHAPAGKRGFYGSWPQTGAPIGMLLSTGALSIFSNLPEADFMAWGWRAPFLLSALLIAVGIYVRLSVKESPVFNQVKEKGAEAKVPAIEAIRYHWREILLAMGARFAENGLYYVYNTFVYTYATQIAKVPRQTVLNAVLVAAFCHAFFILGSGALSDRIGRRPLYLGGALFAGLMGFPFYWLVDSKEFVFITLGLILGMLGHAGMYGPQASFLSELFGARVRYSGISIGYQLASVFAGGLSPLIATSLLAGFGGSSLPISFYMIVLALITLVAVLLARETLNRDISGEPEEVRKRLAREGIVEPAR